MISVDNLTLLLGKRIILNHINAEFPSGQIHGLVGRNGSGKTMLMKCISGFIRPTNGSITIDGKQLGSKSDFPKNMGILIETPGFLPYVSGMQNLKMLAQLRNRINTAQIRQTMELVELDPDLKLPVRKYSLGMRQRLGLAQALMETPDILLLDEPFNGLDKGGMMKMRVFLKNYCTENRTIILASHSAEDIAILCDTVWEMEQGVLKRVKCDLGCIAYYGGSGLV